MLIGSAAMLFPYLWMIGISLASQQQLFRNPPEWFPNPILLSNYPEALTQLKFATALGNTVYIPPLSLRGQLRSVRRAASPSPRLRWPGRKLLFVVLLA